MEDESDVGGKGRSVTHATAHLYWDGQWSDPAARRAWEEPEPFVMRALSVVAADGTAGKTAIDVGCGAGRHALAMAAAGFRTLAFDASQASIRHVLLEAEARGLTIEASVASMDALPCPEASVDWAVAWNVLYHGTRAELEAAVAALRSALKPGGRLDATFISKRNVFYRRGLRIDEDTYIDPSTGDKAHAHCYSSFRDLCSLLYGFEPIHVEEYEQASYAGAWHWRVSAIRGEL